jgi:hypothetical protein
VKVLVACEFSGIVRDAFIERGHDAISCDLLPTERPGPHYQGDVRDMLAAPWDLLIAHPPCTHLAVSGARHFGRKVVEQREALDFVRLLLNAPVPRIALENPVSVISSRIRPADQVIQPWEFGHAESKATCLWLKNLPPLCPTHIVEPEFARRADGTFVRDKKGKRYSRFHYESFHLPADQRGHERSRTFEGIAGAMADQWSNVSFAPVEQLGLFAA